MGLFARTAIIMQSAHCVFYAFLSFLLLQPLTISFARTGIPTESFEEGSSSIQNEVGYAVTVDAAGNVYVTGKAEGRKKSSIRPYSGGATDCFVAKLNDSGFLQWYTYLGGSGVDVCRAIASDEDGNIYVTGESATVWEQTVRIFSGGSSDCFVTKLDSNGKIQWNTFLGGPQYDGGYAIEVDKDYNVFVAGNSVDTWGMPIRPHSGNSDGFAARLDRNGRLIWNTFMGGDDYDGNYALVLDASDNVFLAGESFSIWGKPIRKFIGGYYGNYDAYVVKLDQHGSLAWNSFFGGIGSDYGRGITLDSKGNVYVTGNTDISWGDPLNPHMGGNDIFVVKLDKQGDLFWNTFAGGQGEDYGRSIAVNWTGNIFLAGQSDGQWRQSAAQLQREGKPFILKMDSSGKIQWHTFLEKTLKGFARGIAIDGIGNVFLTGEIVSSEDKNLNEQGEIMRVFVGKLDNAGRLQWKVILNEK